MFLLVLDRHPCKAAELVPDRLKFKQLIELCQLICSAGLSHVYKSIPQGKELQRWIKEHQEWTFRYGVSLYNYCVVNMNLKIDTKIHLLLCLGSLDWKLKRPSTAVFRYSKDYVCNIPTNTELFIDECIEEYTKYVQWKKENNVKGYI